MKFKEISCTCCQKVITDEEIKRVQFFVIGTATFCGVRCIIRYAEAVREYIYNTSERLKNERSN